MSDDQKTGKLDLEEYVSKRFEQNYENLPIRSAVELECHFCDNTATKMDETDAEDAILICDECADEGQQKLEEYWGDVEEGE